MVKYDNFDLDLQKVKVKNWVNEGYATRESDGYGNCRYTDDESKTCRNTWNTCNSACRA